MGNIKLKLTGNMKEIQIDKKEKEKEIMEQFVDCLMENPDHAYDFMAQNGHMFTKGELTTIVKELLYGIYSNVKESQNEILEDVAEELNEMYSEGWM